MPVSTRTIGKLQLAKSTVLIPEMNRSGAHLFAAALRAFDADARVLATYQGLDLGRKYTSGKECYPCLVTLGDLLHFVEKEKQRLGAAFRADQYVFFMPESNGPCRFGMYNKYQRMVLDALPGLQALKISALTTTDNYSPAGLIEKGNIQGFKKAAYLSFVVADVLDRFTWRVRPYEKKPGWTDAFSMQALQRLCDVLEACGANGYFDPMINELEGIIAEGKEIIDRSVPPKPRIGMVGEIFLRMHRDSNQDLIRVLERYGAEVVNASMGEWINYVSYDGLRQARKRLCLSLQLLRVREIKASLKDMLNFGITLLFQEKAQKAVFKKAQARLDIAGDQRIGHLENILKTSEAFSFDIPTEACLSIPGILHCARNGYHGVVNVYPFTCMPGTTTSAVVRPIMNQMGFPFLDTPYDGSIQPNREAAIRTFMYQAQQHMERNGRKI
jgi:predicted nucleotide-binding protein (sugar kinase/HSP70/actin superfamily)